ncbi:MAG: preprotein translocase subunit SecG [Parvularcula sp.]|jgi:preprotein translocase subunit SecG|nr:preprotein translocase subunit SecG [Parvularcula sp.]
MIAIILTIHTMIVLALVGVVLLQRSEGGALGMGGGGGGFMSGRGAATALTRTTTVLAALFFTSSLILALVADRGEGDTGFLPVEEEEGLEDDDFSDFLGTAPASDEQETLPAEPETNVVPDDLGLPAEEEVPAEDTPPSDQR